MYHGKNDVMPTAEIQMDLETIILSKVKSDNKRQISYDTTYMQYLKYDTNDLICKIETRHTEN